MEKVSGNIWHSMCFYNDLLPYISLTPETAVQFWGEACVSAAQGDGALRSRSWTLHCFLCYRADHRQTAAGRGQCCRICGAIYKGGSHRSHTLLSFSLFSTGRGVSGKPIRILFVWGEGSPVEGTQRGEALPAAPSSSTWGGGGQGGVQLEHWGGICEETVPQN